MWLQFRRRYLQRIYVPAFNFIYFTVRNIFKYSASKFRERRRIQRLVREFIHELNASKERRIRVLYDLEDSPHTFGDFMVVVLLCRFLVLSGHHVRLTVVDAKRRADWSELEEESQDQRIRDLLSLAKFLLPPLAEVEKVDHYKIDPSTINLDSTSFYVCAPYFLDLLITKYHWVVPVDFLLESSADVSSEPYIAWHIRLATYDDRRNFTSATMKSDFKELQKRFPGYQVMLISDAVGLESAFQALTGSSETKTRDVEGTQVIAQPKPGFQNAIPAALGAEFYFQRGGGGIGVAAIFSSVPYINLCPDKSYFHGRGRLRIMPWSNENQFFVYVKKDLRSYSIAKLLNVVKV